MSAPFAPKTSSLAALAAACFILCLGVYWIHHHSPSPPPPTPNTGTEVSVKDFLVRSSGHGLYIVTVKPTASAGVKALFAKHPCFAILQFKPTCQAQGASAVTASLGRLAPTGH
jgi:hypothetical protein